MKFFFKSKSKVLLVALLALTLAIYLFIGTTKVYADLYAARTFTLNQFLNDNHEVVDYNVQSVDKASFSRASTSGQTLIIKYNGTNNYEDENMMSFFEWNYRQGGSVSTSYDAASVRVTSNKPMDKLFLCGHGDETELSLESSTANSYTYYGMCIYKNCQYNKCHNGKTNIPTRTVFICLCTIKFFCWFYVFILFEVIFTHQKIL